jgi:hypothetical protein
MIAVVQFWLDGDTGSVFVADGTKDRVRIGEHVGHIRRDEKGWWADRAAVDSYRTPGEAATRELQEWLNAKTTG